MTDSRQRTTEAHRSLHPYVSDLALRVLGVAPTGGWSEVDGSLAFFDVSGFTRLTERLASLGRGGAEYINDVLNTVFKGLIEGVFRSGGDVLEFGGDAMVVLFTGDEHERRAAIAATETYRFMANEGTVVTPLGNARLRMSCGMATGTQAYHLLGTTRRALMVVGPISTEMAQLESAANAGQVRINERLASALPRSWVDSSGSDGAVRLRLGRVTADEQPEQSRTRPPASDDDISRLLPTQFRSLVDGSHRAGELKQVAMSFLRLDHTDELLASEGTDGLHHVLAEISDIIDRAAADLDVCWLETQAEANSVRWTLIAGAPTATERDGERLLRVLLRIAEETPLPLRIGANLGVVFVGDMGHPDRCTFIVMGDATNLAARLMTKAAAGDIIVGERLYKTCPGQFEWTPLEPFLVKGKRSPVQAFSVRRVAGDSQVHDDHQAHEADLPMVGRDDELARLLAAIAAGGTVELVGEAGVGKTRLWHEARGTDGKRRWFVLRCEPHEVGAPYLPFRRLLRAAAGIGPNADQQTAIETITAFVEQVAPNLTPWLPLIADVIGIEVPTSDDVEALDSAFRADRLRVIVAELVLALAGDGSVIVLEDVHWIDEASKALVGVLSGMLGPRNALVLTRRPGGWSPSSVTTIDISAIDNDFADQLLLRELPAASASDATLSRLRSSAAGNPLYLIELARSVALSPAGSGAVYPETIERLLAARIDELSVGGRELIRDASVLGSAMSRSLASRVLGRSDLAEAETWQRELGDLMVLDEDTVRFRHDLIRAAAYEGLSVRRRRAVHRRAGDVIEEWGDSAPVADPVAALAFHATGSGLPERIIRWNHEAASDAMDRGAMEIAEWLLRDVTGAQREIGAKPADCCTTLQLLAVAAERAGHPEPALEALTRASRLAEPTERALIAVDRARQLEKLGRYRAALQTTARALRTCPDPEVSGHLRLARATIRNFLGQWSECLELSQALLRDFEHSDDQRLLAQAHLLAEWCCMYLGLPERVEHERAATALLTELDDSIGLANLLLNRGESAWRECRVLEAMADFRASSDRYKRAGDVLGAALADNNLAEILTLKLQLDDAEGLLTRAQRVTQAAHYPHGTFTTVSGLSRIAAWRGEIETALRLQSDALNGFRHLRADDLVVDSLVRLVEIHVIGGDASAALVAADEAGTALAQLGHVPVVPSTLNRLRARALRLAGRDGDARRAFEVARDLATRDGFTYEIALSSIGLAHMNGDDAGVAAGLAQLTELGVALPPGS